MVSTVEAFIKRHPLVRYHALVLIISWGVVLRIVGPGGFPLRWQRLERPGVLLYIAILAGPCSAGILMIGLIDGRSGLIFAPEALTGMDLLTHLTASAATMWVLLVVIAVANHGQ
jgi:hypothetical protein